MSQLEEDKIYRVEREGERERVELGRRELI